ncbi:hypothetical protein [Streptomyces sp. NPDC001315]|uniref:hypothetical protein n=1 Tax=Streptomyces sp. NPDC001315 TaxID=3364562 RepID=UPI0036CD034E
MTYPLEVPTRLPLHDFGISLSNGNNFGVRVYVSQVSQALGDVDNPHEAGLVEVVLDYLKAIPAVSQINHMALAAPVQTVTTINLPEA